MLKAEWAYDFTARVPIRAVRTTFNEAGPWQWQAHDSQYYGDYLNCRPEPHVRLRVHEYPGIGLVNFTGRRLKGFKAMLEIEPESTATRAEIDTVFRRLLQALGARHVTETVPYDC
jgi:hypothetical protein